jgi:glycerol-3-phosphate O-acyltransferase
MIRHLYPDIEEWPVARISKERKVFVENLNAFVLERILDNNNRNLSELISKTVYLEKQRIKLNPWKVDPVDDKGHWNNVGKTLELIENLEDKNEAEIELLKKIINRYSEEIVGHFDIKTFRFSRIFLTSFFKRIFNSYFKKGHWRWGSKNSLLEKINMVGDIEHVSSLFDKGTMVILPTHHSNLDSIMVGYAIDTKIGLPVFSYGAGLNLYNVELAAYFMNRLGAFRVDRRKKNPIYLECLKGMTTYSLTRGVNNIFFPGGTRSRSGATESKIKLGLISSLIEAQRLNLEQGKDKKIFIVPMNINYHFVFEAKNLIDQYLRQIGKERYTRNREQSPGFYNNFQFIRKLFSKESEVYISLGRTMDVFGNTINDKGESVDKFGNIVHLEDYFITDDLIKADPQRESIYTRLLGEAVVQEYSKNQVVLSSNLVSFVAFQMLFSDMEYNDVVGFITSNTSKVELPYDEFESKCAQIQILFQDWHRHGRIICSPVLLNNDITNVIMNGLSLLGSYHSKKVLGKKENIIFTDDLSLLFFYHNRLTNYPIQEEIEWVNKIVVD